MYTEKSLYITNKVCVSKQTLSQKKVFCIPKKHFVSPKKHFVSKKKHFVFQKKHFVSQKQSGTKEFRPTWNRIPEHHHIEEQFFKQVGIVLDRIMAPSDPEVLIDLRSNLSSAKETVLFRAFCSSRLILLLNWELWMILFSAEAILASSTSKFGIEIPRVDDQNLQSTTESTNSTSLTHSIRP